MAENRKTQNKAKTATKRATKVTNKKNTSRSKYFVLVEPHLDLIRDWRRDGDTIQVISDKLGINKATFCKYQKQFPELEKVMIESRQHLLADLKDTLYRRAKGYDIVEVKKFKDNEGKESTETKTKHIYSDTALLFALVNLDPENWQSINKVEISKGEDEQEDNFKGMIEAAKESIKRLENGGDDNGED